jgi:hypothetical protein
MSEEERVYTEEEKDESILWMLDQTISLIDDCMKGMERSERARLYAIIRTQLQLSRGFGQYELAALAKQK